MQRLFNTFADGWPGCGLLLQRLVVGAGLLHNDFLLFRETSAPAAHASQSVAAALAVCMVVGLWTPVAGVLLAAFEVWSAVASAGNPEIAILLATFGATLALIGPGAFSVDARLFGRKHIAS